MSYFDDDEEDDDDDGWQASQQIPAALVVQNQQQDQPIVSLLASRPSSTIIFQTKAAAKRVREDPSKQTPAGSQQQQQSAGKRPAGKRKRTATTNTTSTAQTSQFTITTPQQTNNNNNDSAIAGLDAKMAELMRLVRTAQTPRSSDFIANANMLDVLSNRDELLRLCEQATNIWIIQCQGFMQYTHYSHCIFSQRGPPKTHHLFYKERQLFAPEHPLQAVYVLAWTQDCKQNPYVLQLHLINEHNSTVAKTILQFSLCVSQNLIQ